MAIKQSIEYKSDKRYFAGFLQHLIDESGILGSVVQEDKYITLMLDDSDTAKLQAFNEAVAKYLPHSIFMGEISTEVVDAVIEPSNFHSLDYPIAPCMACMERLNTPSSKHYLDGNMLCNHYANPAQESYEDHTIFSPHYSQGATLLLTNASKVNELFILTSDELKALFSIEKPTLKVTISNPTLQEMSGKKFISIKSPYNNKSLLASINAKESEIDYLFFHRDCDLNAVVVQKNISLIYDKYEDLESLHEDGVINRFSNIQKEAGFESAIGCYLSTQGISFVVANEMATKRVISFGEFSMSRVIERFKNDAKRTKLLENLAKEYPFMVEQLEEPLGLFESIATILELDEISFEALSDKSYEFRGNGGLKIDTHFGDDDFDYDAFIGSIISFKLAGVETHYLAYSIFEALADMSISICNQLKSKFKISNFIMMGDMFGNSVLQSRILSKFQLSSPYFSKQFALDDC